MQLSIVALQAGADRLRVDRIIRLGKAAVELMQRLVLVQVQQQRDQRHADRNAVGGLLEIDGAAVAVERSVELVDPRQRMHDAGVGVFRLVQEFRVDLWIVAFLLAPALLLEARHIDGVDLLLHQKPVIDFRIGNERQLVRLVGGDIERVDRADLSGILRHHAAVEFLAQPAIDVGRQLHAGRGQRDRWSRRSGPAHRRRNGWCGCP